MAPSFGAPSAAQTAADQVRVNSAVAKLDAVRKKAADIDAGIRRTSSELDGVLAEQDRLRATLSTRVVAMYQSGDDAYLAILLTSETLQDFTARWQLLDRMNSQDVGDLKAIDVVRTRVQRSARSLIDLQAAQARATEDAAREVAAARKALAADAAALAEYNARIARAAKPASPPKAPSGPQPTGSGAWQTAVASHYGINFTGRGASGYRIGPYSMMLAHKTLPFHTLIEFEYNGKTAVASVEDRGPFTPGREFDLGPGVIRVLGFNGVHPIRYRIIGR